MYKMRVELQLSSGFDWSEDGNYGEKAQKREHGDDDDDESSESETEASSQVWVYCISTIMRQE